MKPNGKLKILSTIAMIDDVVKQVGGEYIDSITLIKGELNPHTYQLVKGDDEKLAFADLIFYNGLGLEHGPSLRNFLEKSPNSIALGNKIWEEEPSAILYQNGQLDPHIWMDLEIWSKTLPFIVEALSKKDPSHSEYFQKNADLLKKEMGQLHLSIQQELQDIPAKKRYLVTSHDAFNYFTRAYLAEPDEKISNKWQERFAAPEGLAPESQLSATDIQNIINHVCKYQIHILFPESNVSKDSIRKIVNACQEKGMRIKIANEFLYADAMGAPGSDGDSYLKMVQHNGKIIAYFLRNNNP